MSDNRADRDFEASLAAQARLPHLAREANPRALGLTPFRVAISRPTERWKTSRREEMIVWARDVLEVGPVLNYHYGHSYTDLTFIHTEERQRNRGGYER
jgi:hypothetical protein